MRAATALRALQNSYELSYRVHIPQPVVLSVVIMTFVLPIAGSRSRSAVSGLRRTVTAFAAWIVIYVTILSLFDL